MSSNVAWGGLLFLAIIFIIAGVQGCMGTLLAVVFAPAIVEVYDGKGGFNDGQEE